MQIQNKLIRYTQHEKDNLLGGKVRIIASNKDIENFILHSTKGSDNAKIYFGKVNLQFAKNINKLFKIDVKYYNISLSAHTIKHIFSHHGQKTELLRGQIPVTSKDIELIPNIISNYDKVYYSGKTAQNKISLTFEQQLDVTYHIIVYISDRSHSLEVKTLYKSHNKKNSAPASNAISLD